MFRLTSGLEAIFFSESLGDLLLPALTGNGDPSNRGAVMIGQTSTGFESVIAQFGVLSILAWFLWYRVSVADPKQQQAFASGQAKQAEQHKQDYQALSDAKKNSRCSYESNATKAENKSTP